MAVCISTTRPTNHAASLGRPTRASLDRTRADDLGSTTPARVDPGTAERPIGPRARVDRDSFGRWSKPWLIRTRGRVSSREARTRPQLAARVRFTAARLSLHNRADDESADGRVSLAEWSTDSRVNGLAVGAYCRPELDPSLTIRGADFRPEFATIGRGRREVENRGRGANRGILKPGRKTGPKLGQKTGARVAKKVAEAEKDGEKRGR